LALVVENPLKGIAVMAAGTKTMLKAIEHVIWTIGLGSKGQATPSLGLVFVFVDG